MYRKVANRFRARLKRRVALTAHPTPGKLCNGQFQLRVVPMSRFRSFFFLSALLPWIAVSAGCGGDEFETNPPNAGDVDGSVDAGLPDGSSDAVDDTTEDASGDASMDAIGVDQANKLPVGEPCSDPAECVSEHCVDGVCCSDECGDCMTCAASGEEGTCTPIPQGENPDEVCGTASEPCTGWCDGDGNCEYPVDGALCGSIVCDSNGVDRIEPRCDGMGNCDQRVESCAPFACDPQVDACFTTCEGNPGACADSGYCEGMTCVAKLELGEGCQAAEMCASNNCVDGVCCDGPCNETCQTCAAQGSLGVCTPYEHGEDPEDECPGEGVCEGYCDGDSQCEFPDSSTVCGASLCQSDNVQVESLCDGAGACESVSTNCGLFVCEETLGACLQSCASHDACVSEAYCDGGLCVEKMNNGSVCAFAYECASNYCEVTTDLTRCCNTSCPSPLDCVTGQCLCDGLSCPGTEACVPWYQDLDRDGYGDPNTVELGCEGSPPTDVNGNPFVRNMDDCYDLNEDVRPDQDAFFAVHRGDNSFDYNCDQTETKEYDDTIAATAACKDCKTISCFTCGVIFHGTFGYTCRPPDGSNQNCGPKIWKSFKQNQPCGSTGMLHSCNREPDQCTNAQTSASTMQRCR